jgi:hypothetical protein
VQLLADAVRTGQEQGLFTDDDPIGFVMSVAGTTAFLGLRTNLLSPMVATPLSSGSLKAELQTWLVRILFRDQTSDASAPQAKAGRSD